MTGLLQKINGRAGRDVPVPGDPADSVKVAALPEATADLAAFAAANIDRAAYLDVYPDVKAAGLDPLVHWLAHGLAEGRALAPGLEVLHGAAALAAEGEDWRRFTWDGRDVAIRACSVAPEAAAESGPHDAADATILAFVRATMDQQAYLAAYADVAASGFDPVLHWLDHGAREGRVLAPGVRVRHGDYAARTAGDGWQRFTWRGVPIAVLPDADVSADLVHAQILAQAHHEPAILSVGIAALPNVRRVIANDPAIRQGIAVRELFDAIGPRPDVVVVLPALEMDDATAYAAGLVDALVVAGRGPVVALITDQQPAAAAGWDELASLEPIRRARVVFWRAFSSLPQVDPMMVARLLNALRPRAVVVADSLPGLDAVGQSGRGLAQSSRIFCTYFHMGLEGQGNIPARYMPRRTLPHAVALTDNVPMQNALERLFGGIPGPGIALLPPRIAPASETQFAARLAARAARAVPSAGRWAWVSRVAPPKGTEILAALARRRPADTFDPFGPLEAPLGALGLDLPNIRYHGTLTDVAAADFSAHDAFLFTSLFAGTPSAVLGMSQHAIPLVLADVGGLRDTLGDDAAIFVPHQGTPEDTAAAFDAALSRLRAMPAEQMEAMLSAARAQVLAHHGPDVHSRAVAALFASA